MGSSYQASYLQSDHLTKPHTWFPFARRGKLFVNIAMGIPKASARNDSDLLDLETKHQVCSMYLWLSNHFKEDNFPYKKKAEAMASDIAELLGESFAKPNSKPESSKDNVHERPQSLIKLFDKRRKEKIYSHDIEEISA